MPAVSGDRLHHSDLSPTKQRVISVICKDNKYHSLYAVSAYQYKKEPAGCSQNDTDTHSGDHIFWKMYATGHTSHRKDDTQNPDDHCCPHTLPSNCRTDHKNRKYMSARKGISRTYPSGSMVETDIPHKVCVHLIWHRKTLTSIKDTAGTAIVTRASQ